MSFDFKESHLRGSGTVDLGLTYSKSCGGNAFGTKLCGPELGGWGEERGEDYKE